MNDRIFHLPRFLRFASRLVTSAFGTLTSLRARASNALKPAGFFAFLAMLFLLLGSAASPATATACPWVIFEVDPMPTLQVMIVRVVVNDLAKRITIDPSCHLPGSLESHVLQTALQRRNAVSTA